MIEDNWVKVTEEIERETEIEEITMSPDEIRLECVRIAASVNSLSPNSVVEDAKKYYEFITTGVVK